jgi:signal transduction histidine kinase/CheY-like chemotaxis protein/HPt (histidine-containing phosphotransfer) domain-containing protein
MKRTVILLCSLLLYADYISAQYTHSNTPVIFRHLTKANGLSSNVVNCILQDRFGFMWLGTDNGLNRYDGRSFILHNHNASDTNSISGNHISTLFEDSKGRIWIGTLNNGLTIYNPVTQQYKRYEHNTRDTTSINKGYVAQVYEDSKGRFWICLYGGGLELFDEHTGKFIHHTWRKDDSTSVACNKVKSIYEIAPDKFLVGTFEAGDGNKDIREDGRINVFDVSTNIFSGLKISNTKFNPAYRQTIHTMQRLVHSIVPDSSGNIWFGSYCGIIKYTPAGSHFDFYQNIETDLTTLSHMNVRSICPYGGKVYFGTEGGGLSVLDTTTGKFTNYKNDPFDLNSISDDLVTYVYKDRENRIWIATDGGGINIIDPPNKDFILYSNHILKISPERRMESGTIRALCPDSNGMVYVGSTNGLTVLNTKTNEAYQLQKTFKLNNRIVNAQVYAISASVGGYYWVGMNDQLMKFHPGSKRLEYYSRPNQLRFPENGNVAYLPIEQIIERPDSILWINYFGIPSVAFRPTNKTVEGDAPLAKSERAIIDRDGIIWSAFCGQGGCNGLIRIDTNWATKEFHHDSNDAQSLSSNIVTGLHCDGKNRIWIATNRGLDLYDRHTEKFIHYRNIENLPDSIIKGITSDADGHLWLLTPDALLRMDSNRHIITFPVNTDLPVHKLENRIIYDNHDGAIYFTANEGLVKFYPGKLKLQQEIKPIYITGFRLFNKPLQPDSSLLLKRYYQFKHDENLITITFSVVDYSDRVSQQYEYKLEGLNDGWVQVGNNNEANFTNLAPGVYIFKIRGSSHQGIWNYESAPITITILKPWWQERWFFISGLVAIIMIVYAYNYYRTSRFRQRTRKLEQMVEQRTAQYREQKEYAENSERLRQQFLANMSHEIRTPINAVSGLTQLLLEKNPTPSQTNYLQAISKSADMLRHIVNDILDLSKIEAGKLQIEAIHFSVRDIAGRVRDILSFAANEKNIALVLVIDESIPETLVGDPFRISQVLLNLCGNAIKFTEEGTITIDIRLQSTQPEKIVLRFAVTDTGIGIPDDKLQILFKDFAQVNPSDTRRHGGTGLGLSISKNLVTLMGGELTAESQPGKGSVFTFTIPLKRGNVNNNPVQAATTIIDGSILDGLHILVADDNEYNRLVLLDTLHLKARVKVDTATTGLEAITLLRNNQYDVILMDVQMPVMSGIEATLKIRSEFAEPECLIPIIALTASTQYADRDRCMQAGMNAVIIKPFKTGQLIETIAEVTGRKKSSTSSISKIDKQDKITHSNIITDLTYLVDFCEGDKQRIGQYVQLYIQSIPGFNSKIETALTANDLEILAELVHAFKPKWVMMGMQGAIVLAVKIEQYCNDDSGNIKEFVEMLVKENNASIAELEPYTN